MSVFLLQLMPENFEKKNFKDFCDLKSRQFFLQQNEIDPVLPETLAKIQSLIDALQPSKS